MFVQKLLSLLLYPLTQSILLLCVALLFLLFKRIRSAVFSLFFVIIWLTLFSLPITAYWLQHKLERLYPSTPIHLLPNADAIIVLGGAITPAPAPTAFPDLSDAGDRPWHAARLYHAGKAPRIVISAGSLPWDKSNESEAVAISRFLVDLDVPLTKMIIESSSDSTYANALHSYVLLHSQGYDKILLVTSAWHMKRAQAVFEHVGFEVIPAPTDFETLHFQPDSLLDWLPKAEALQRSSRAIKEIIGFQVYRQKGWIE